MNQATEDNIYWPTYEESEWELKKNGFLEEIIIESSHLNLAERIHSINPGEELEVTGMLNGHTSVIFQDTVRLPRFKNRSPQYTLLKPMYLPPPLLRMGERYIIG